MKNERMRERIMRNSVKDDSGCWIWTGNYNNDGYPRICVRVGGYPTKLYAHRVSFEAFKERRIRAGFQIDHSCVNPSCVNPEHLGEVLPKTNATYRERRKRKRLKDYAAAQA